MLAQLLNKLKPRIPRAAVPPCVLDLDRLRRSLAALPPDDQLWADLMALLEAYALAEAKALASPALDDAEAHRLRGRVGMCFDLKADLERLRIESEQVSR